MTNKNSQILMENIKKNQLNYRIIGNNINSETKGEKKIRMFREKKNHWKNESLNSWMPHTHTHTNTEGERDKYPSIPRGNRNDKNFWMTVFFCEQICCIYVI